ncbi:MAG: DUF512 domain-containing protein [Dethiobacter sp.]|nr:DUF512 domain-containing protein [Dethiobacter sp.]
MHMQKGSQVESVVAGSIAEELGISPGDHIIYINGIEPGDILDWRLAEGCEELILTVAGKNGGLTEYEIEKDYDESLGIVFDSPTIDAVRPCQNRCLFCFVDQLPKELRRSLYLKDDDYRLSFISGSYVTLTNLTDTDLERIMRLHLSPLYVSVHATEPELRRCLLNHNRAGLIMDVLKKLSEAGIVFHAQVVLCPGINDGMHLERTINDLYNLTSVHSLAVVPVGLTGHRQGLYNLYPCDGMAAQKLLQQVKSWQLKSLKERGGRFIFASDEFYTLAGQVIPSHQEYEEYPQLENGVGLARLLYNDWEAWQNRLPPSLAKETTATVVTGVSAGHYLEPIVNRLNEIKNLTLRLVLAANTFFGGHVTVAGLLTGHDILASLENHMQAGTVYLPRVMLREGKNLFLDGYTVDELSDKLGKELRIVSSLDDFLFNLFETESR